MPGAPCDGTANGPHYPQRGSMKRRWIITPMLLVASVRLPGADGDRTLVALHLNRNVARVVGPWG
jgi:hypothetical protein